MWLVVFQIQNTDLNCNSTIVQQVNQKLRSKELKLCINSKNFNVLMEMLINLAFREKCYFHTQIT